MGNQTETDHDLFSPTLQEGAKAIPQYDNRPWQINSQVWIALFGGVAAVTIIAYLNGRRLHIKQNQLWQIVAVGVVGIIVVFLLTYLSGTWELAADSYWQETAQRLRWINRITAMLCYWYFAGLQRPYVRQYQFRTNGEYDSLWVPGLILVFVVGGAQNLILLAAINQFL